jgi:hypothetical protein
MTAPRDLEVQRLRRLFRFFGPRSAVAVAAAFNDQLRQAAESRPPAWVFAETPGLVATTDPGLGARTGSLARDNSNFLVGASLRAATDPGEPRIDTVRKHI